MTTPIPLPPNQPPERFYLGGERIARFRGLPTSQPRTPEDWLGSATTLFGEPSLGLTTIAGRPLRDLIEADPEHWLGADHRTAFGTDTQLLVKLLEAGQRLPVHVHPDDDFAADHLGLAHGKAEAWYIVDGGEVFLGFTRTVTRHELEDLVTQQRTAELLALCHRREVAPGDTVFIPAGLPHAIGESVFLVEVQQPEDLSILLEWQDFEIDGTADGHLGLGFDRALDAVHTHALTSADVDALIAPESSARSALVPAADAYFRVERLLPGARSEVAPGLAVLVVLGGAGELIGPAGATPLIPGTVLLLPHAAGALTLTGTVHAIVCRPPDPERNNA
ncbi:class I mannose-6-phosphate isomerase [Ruania zhangjianzhongii]|uniref:class I mannose-6-phosphate isomerase n=1 Tax=Ruania zhangjianzhongii TaxID=2603206 RepID=UPI0011C7266A|nr:class I mannose-6-phosphate isomerase [Ruania zhangjianzhongii]